jgi:hypothetical protein
MKTDHFVVETDPLPGDVEFLEERINEFNLQTTRIPFGGLLSIFVRDDAGALDNPFSWRLKLKLDYVAGARLKPQPPDCPAKRPAFEPCLRIHSAQMRRSLSNRSLNFLLLVITL